MHKCEFCFSNFHARPQVKRPRACPNCQKKRQRANEKAWHIKHKDQFDQRYHQVQKMIRFKLIKQVLVEFLKYLRVGCSIHGQQLHWGLFESYFLKFLGDLGIRRVNKFWQVT